MKLNRKTFKVTFVFVIIVGTLIWAVNLVRSHSYQGTDLNFTVGLGRVIVTNPSIRPVSVQLIEEAFRFVSFSSTIKGLPSSSTWQGSEGSSTEFLTFDRPFVISEFRVLSGAPTSADVTFVVSSFTEIGVSARLLDTSDTNITIIVAAIVILGSLFYILSVTGHTWIKILRNNTASNQDTRPIVTVMLNSRHGCPMAHGEHRMDKSERSFNRVRII